MKHIQALWDGFSSKMCPPGTPELQVRMMRHSFYAGSAVLFSIITKKIDDPATTSVEGAKFMGEISTEIQDFANSISAGQA
jgi:hypothetical protein